MKDGKVYTYESVVDGSGEQFETGSSGKLYGKFTETVTTKDFGSKTDKSIAIL